MAPFVFVSSALPAAVNPVAVDPGTAYPSPLTATRAPAKIVAEAATLRAQGFDFYDWGSGAARLVTSWQHGEEDVRPLAHAIAAL